MLVALIMSGMMSLMVSFSHCFELHPRHTCETNPAMSTILAILLHTETWAV